MIRERRMPFGALSDRPPPHRTRAQESVRPRGRSGNIVDPPGGRWRPPPWPRQGRPARTPVSTGVVAAVRGCPTVSPRRARARFVRSPRTVETVPTSRPIAVEDVTEPGLATVSAVEKSFGSIVAIASPILLVVVDKLSGLAKTLLVPVAASSCRRHPLGLNRRSGVCPRGSGGTDGPKAMTLRGTGEDRGLRADR